VLFYFDMFTSLYMHIPFCTSRCGYCDFNTYAGVNSLIPQYVNTLCKEVIILSTIDNNPKTVHTIYFGGGTPSLISIEDLQTVLSTIRNVYDVTPDVEITLEANPGSVTADYFNRLKMIGFTRLSLGMQSAHTHELALLERKHDFNQVAQSVHWAADAGFRHISLDLIFGIPGQTLDSWNRSLDAAINFPIDHLSLYSLTVEEGTPLQRQILEGSIEPPDEDLAGDMFELAIKKLPDFGFSQYEISNWSKNQESRSLHNIQYWKCHPYLGLGAGAHGYYGHYRYENIAGILPYVAAIGKDSESIHPRPPAEKEGHSLNPWDEMQEFMMLGLRLTEDGVSRMDFVSRFSYSMDDLFKGQIENLFHLKLIENHPDNPDRLRLTAKGIVFGNRVFMEFVGNPEPDELKNQS